MHTFIIHNYTTHRHNLYKNKIFLLAYLNGTKYNGTKYLYFNVFIHVLNTSLDYSVIIMLHMIVFNPWS